MSLYIGTQRLNIPKAPKRKVATPGGAGQRQPRKRDTRHLAVVAGLPSVLSGILGVQVCHIRYADLRFDKPFTGLGEKPSDKWVLPMTPHEHQHQHSMNEREFWKSHGVDATALADTLYRVWDEIIDPLGAQEIMKRIIARRYGRHHNS